MILDVGEELLKSLGYMVVIASSGKEALEIYEKNKDKIEIVILDMIMPGKVAGESYDKMEEIYPPSRSCFLVVIVSMVRQLRF